MDYRVVALKMSRSEALSWLKSTWLSSYITLISRKKCDYAIPADIELLIDADGYHGLFYRQTGIKTTCQLDG